MIQKLQAPHLFFFFILVFSFNFSFAQGDLMIMPKRLVFNGAERSQEINLVNTGADTATYAISFIQYKMKEDGNFEEITKPEEGQHFADEFLRYYPRRVSLAPKEAQTIRVQITKRNLLQPGEYRSHMYFRAVEEETALGNTDSETDEKAISINIKTVFGISIPVIIREGDNNTKVALENLTITEDKKRKKLSFEFNRIGDFSTYGDLEIDYISENKRIALTQVRGLAVYTPNKKREFSLNLPEVEGIDYTKGSLEIKYKTEDGKVYGTKSLKLK